MIDSCVVPQTQVFEGAESGSKLSKIASCLLNSGMSTWPSFWTDNIEAAELPEYSSLVKQSFTISNQQSVVSSQ
jgi:hypothetical protein